MGKDMVPLNGLGFSASWSWTAGYLVLHFFLGLHDNEIANLITETGRGLPGFV